MDRHTRPPAGPAENPNGDSVAIGRHAGQVWAYGQAVAWNTGKKPAVLERIWLVKATPGLEVLDTRVGGPKRRLLSLATWSQWPSPNFSDLHPVAGFRIDPMSQPKGERGAEFIFVLRAKKPGRYISRAVGVNYTVDGSDHRSYITSALGVCVTATDQPLDRNCPTPEPLSPQEINE